LIYKNSKTDSSKKTDSTTKNKDFSLFHTSHNETTFSDRIKQISNKLIVRAISDLGYSEELNNMDNKNVDIIDYENNYNYRPSFPCSENKFAKIRDIDEKNMDISLDN